MYNHLLGFTSMLDLKNMISDMKRAGLHERRASDLSGTDLRMKKYSQGGLQRQMGE